MGRKGGEGGKGGMGGEGEISVKGGMCVKGRKSEMGGKIGNGRNVQDSGFVWMGLHTDCIGDIMDIYETISNILWAAMFFWDGVNIARKMVQYRDSVWGQLGPQNDAM